MKLHWQFTLRDLLLAMGFVAVLFWSQWRVRQAELRRERELAEQQQRFQLEREGWAQSRNSLESASQVLFKELETLRAAQAKAATTSPAP
ncbi:MAG: hypothetical protein U0836_03145 [Pirellulales bacterium]